MLRATHPRPGHVSLGEPQLGYPTTDSLHADSTSPSFLKKAGTPVRSWKLSLRSLYSRQLCEGVVCSLLQRHQTSDKTVRSRATDAQEYGTLLLCAIDVIGDEVVFQLLCVSYPLFCTVVKLPHVPISCHLIPALLPLCHKGSPMELTEGSTWITDGKETMQGMRTNMLHTGPRGKTRPINNKNYKTNSE